VGSTARLVLVPDERLVIAILTNSGNQGQRALIDELTRLFLAN
jgi:hypothetical protein